jgi:hypothetical protein
MRFSNTEPGSYTVSHVSKTSGKVTHWRVSYHHPEGFTFAESTFKTIDEFML